MKLSRVEELVLCLAEKDAEIERLKERLSIAIKRWKDRVPNKRGISGCACEFEEDGETIVKRCLVHASEKKQLKNLISNAKEKCRKQYENDDLLEEQDLCFEYTWDIEKGYFIEQEIIKLLETL